MWLQSRVKERLARQRLTRMTGSGTWVVSYGPGGINDTHGYDAWYSEVRHRGGHSEYTEGQTLYVQLDACRSSWGEWSGPSDSGAYFPSIRNTGIAVWFGSGGALQGEP